MKEQRILKAPRTVTKCAGRGVAFEQTERNDIFVSTMTTVNAGLTARVVDQPGLISAEVTMYDAASVTADEFELPFFDDKAVTFKFETQQGIFQTFTVYGMTATDLIAALEADLMANTPEAETELAQ